jgi:hypothetical protein
MTEPKPTYKANEPKVLETFANTPNTVICWNKDEICILRFANAEEIAEFTKDKKGEYTTIISPVPF